MLLQYNLGELTNHHNGYFQSLTQRPIIQYITPLLEKLLIRTTIIWIFLFLILTSNSLKYQSFTPSGCKDIGTKKTTVCGNEPSSFTLAPFFSGTNFKNETRSISIHNIYITTKASSLERELSLSIKFSC